MTVLHYKRLFTASLVSIALQAIVFHRVYYRKYTILGNL